MDHVAACGGGRSHSSSRLKIRALIVYPWCGLLHVAPQTPGPRLLFLTRVAS